MTAQQLSDEIYKAFNYPATQDPPPGQEKALRQVAAKLAQQIREYIKNPEGGSVNMYGIKDKVVQASSISNTAVNTRGITRF